MNISIIEGTATKDAEEKRGEKSDHPYTDFRLASDHPRRPTSFNAIRVLKKSLAKWAAEYVTKGRRYLVKGYSDGPKTIADWIEFQDYPRTDQDQSKSSRTTATINKKIDKMKARARKKG